MNTRRCVYNYSCVKHMFLYTDDTTSAGCQWNELARSLDRWLKQQVDDAIQEVKRVSFAKLTAAAYGFCGCVHNLIVAAAQKDICCCLHIVVVIVIVVAIVIFVVIVMRPRQFTSNVNRRISPLNTGCCRKYMLLLFAIVVCMMAGLHFSKLEPVETAHQVQTTTCPSWWRWSFSYVDILFFCSQKRCQ